MTALIKHMMFKTYQNAGSTQLTNLFLVQTRFYRPQNLAKKNKVKPKKIQKVPVPETRKLKSVEDSLASRGFLRCLPDYNPPEDVEERLESIFNTVIGSAPSNDSSYIPSKHKFVIFDLCFEAFRHGIPNSMLNEVNNYGDLKRFYATPVDATLPLDKLKKCELPPNLHVQYEPVRFLPETSGIFNGQTAFPKCSTIVSGLRPKRKYKGQEEPKFWPFDNYLR